MNAQDSTFLLGPGTARAVHLRAGERLDIIDVDGQQVSDVIAFNASEPQREWLSPTHTRSALGHTKLRAQDTLLTNLRRPAMRLVHDDVGVHDMSFAMCDDQRYVQDFDAHGHANCHDAMVEALAAQPDAFVPDPFNIFQNSAIEPDGTIVTEAPVSKPGDRITLAALTELLLVASACPQDMNACNGGDPSRIQLVVHPAGRTPLLRPLRKDGGQKDDAIRRPGQPGAGH